jgi:putative tryptophan/tyrosine transport system substrate-binding protein
MIKGREFIAGLGGVAAWPLAARAQQPAMPVIGYLDAGSLETKREFVAALHRGLSQTGYFEGRNLAVEYRWAEDRLDRLPALAADLVRRQVAVIIATPTPAAVAAKAATKSIPIVFTAGADPVEIGLVASLNRPGGNLTGMSTLTTAVAAKRLALLHELMPAETLIAYLVNPTNPVFSNAETSELRDAARTLGVRLLILNASDPSEFEAAFTTLVLGRASGLVVSNDTLFQHYPEQLVALAARYRLPAIYAYSATAAAGGLMSYGTDFLGSVRQAGVYAGRILKGEKPADLPVQQVTKLREKRPQPREAVRLVEGMAGAAVSPWLQFSGFNVFSRERLLAGP